uniref:Uncharacterized protein n=1 Tax=Romanomermis culicivorax TaxID=13658 RepID=A0A915KT77_ROMCU
MRQSKVLACIAISNTVLVTVPNFVYIFVLWFGFGEQTGQNIRFVGLVTNGLRCTLMLPLCIALRQDFRAVFSKMLSFKKRASCRREILYSCRREIFLGGLQA